VTLTEFLMARIADREAMARAAMSAGARWVTAANNAASVAGADAGLLILFNNPACVLAECEAQRRIAELHSDDHECSTFDRNGERDNCTWVLGDDCSTMRLLALPYAAHAEYDEAWRP
jgi:hypothetical protein